MASPAQVNASRIVAGIHGQLLPSGGTMQIQLDPPSLGAMTVVVRMNDGTMSASFETTTDAATHMLSHSLGQLKLALESQGVSVEKLNVRQSSRDGGAADSEKKNEQTATDDPTTHQQRQRRELLRRMWQRVAGGEDDLDMVA